MKQSFSMMVLNKVQPFATESFARKVAMLVLDDRYTRTAFAASDSDHVIDGGDHWVVTFKNALVAEDAARPVLSNGFLMPMTLSFKVRKCDAGIVDVI